MVSAPIFAQNDTLLQIQDTKGKVLITNDGATILKQMEVIHPTAKMVSELNLNSTRLMARLAR